MTTTEFNTKYEDYLEEDYYGLAIPLPHVIKYLDKVFQELIEIPGFKYSQIKLKFNSARFYCANVPEERVRDIENTIMDFIKM